MAFRRVDARDRTARRWDSPVGAEHRCLPGQMLAYTQARVLPFAAGKEPLSLMHLPARSLHDSSPASQRKYFEDALVSIREESRVRSLYCVNGVPKSGSTFTMRVLRLATGGRLEFGGDYQFAEHRFSIGGLAQSLLGADGVVVFHGHMLADYLSITTFKHLQIRYVNIVRNIFDVMVSVHDHLSRTANDRGVTTWPGLRVAGFNDWARNRRYDFIAHFIIPWYFRYMEGWYRNAPDSIFTYEDMVIDPGSYFSRMEQRLDLTAGIMDYQRPEAKRNARFNVGVLGRGAPLRDDYADLMKSYADCYPNFDYSLVGL